MKKEVVLVLSDIRSCYNVGSILRSCDGAGIQKVYCCGITPYPRLVNDARAEHVKVSNTKQIHKAGLDAEEIVEIEHFDDILTCLDLLKKDKYELLALENKVERTVGLFEYNSDSQKTALIVGSETEGLSADVLEKCNSVLDISMRGKKNSLNVAVAAGIAMYWILR